MALYVMADTHLSLSLDKPMDIFGARWANHEKKIEQAWCATVTEADTVVLPGDISWAMTLEEARADLAFLDALPGQKLIGRGNHDYWWSTLHKMEGFLAECGMTTLRFLYNNAYRVGEIAVCGSRGWWNDPKAAPRDTDFAKIINREVLRLEMSLQQGDALGGEKVVFLHFPPVYRDFVCREILDVLHRYDVKRCYYGHLHNLYDLPPDFTYEGITFPIVSSDYLLFTPLLVAP